jgi:hypothetical protein
MARARNVGICLVRIIESSLRDVTEVAVLIVYRSPHERMTLSRPAN